MQKKASPSRAPSSPFFKAPCITLHPIHQIIQEIFWRKTFEAVQDYVLIFPPFLREDYVTNSSFTKFSDFTFIGLVIPRANSIFGWKVGNSGFDSPFSSSQNPLSNITKYFDQHFSTVIILSKGFISPNNVLLWRLLLPILLLLTSSSSSSSSSQPSSSAFCYFGKMWRKTLEHQSNFEVCHLWLFPSTASQFPPISSPMSSSILILSSWSSPAKLCRESCRPLCPVLSSHNIKDQPTALCPFLQI